jgi:acyl carrier protein
LNDETISLGEETTADDIEGWDSLRHITLISAIEDEFDVEFEMKDIVGLKNVGELVDVITREL